MVCLDYQCSLWWAWIPQCAAHSVLDFGVLDCCVLVLWCACIVHPVVKLDQPFMQNLCQTQGSCMGSLWYSVQRDGRFDDQQMIIWSKSSDDKRSSYTQVWLSLASYIILIFFGPTPSTEWYGVQSDSFSNEVFNTMLHTPHVQIQGEAKRQFDQVLHIYYQHLRITISPSILFFTNFYCTGFTRWHRVWVFFDLSQWKFS